MKLLRVTDNIEIIRSRKSDKHYTQLATNKDILASVIGTCKQFHSDCETCPYWLKNKFNCIWKAHKIIGKDVMAYWDIGEIEEKEI